MLPKRSHCSEGCKIGKKVTTDHTVSNMLLPYNGIRVCKHSVLLTNVVGVAKVYVPPFRVPFSFEVGWCHYRTVGLRPKFRLFCLPDDLLACHPQVSRKKDCLYVHLFAMKSTWKKKMGTRASRSSSIDPICPSCHAQCAQSLSRWHNPAIPYTSFASSSHFVFSSWPRA